MLVYVVVEVQVENREAVVVRECVKRGPVEAEEPVDVQEVVVYVGSSEFFVCGGGGLNPVRPILEKVHVAQLYGMEHFVVYGDPDAVRDVFVIGVRVGRVVQGRCRDGVGAHSAVALDGIDGDVTFGYVVEIVVDKDFGLVVVLGAGVCRTEASVAGVFAHDRPRVAQKIQFGDFDRVQAFLHGHLEMAGGVKPQGGAHFHDIRVKLICAFERHCKRVDEFWRGGVWAIP